MDPIIYSDSILDSVKVLMDISLDDTSFDDELILHINPAIQRTIQLGVSDKASFRIIDKTSVWSDYVLSDTIPGLVELTSYYVYLKVRLVFDTPINSKAAEAIDKSILEYEFSIDTAITDSK